jgi:DNA polymerase-3 subunit epsilon
MTLLKKELFVCLDCETTGLDPAADHIIEIAVAIFSFDGIVKSFETLVDPGCPIPESSIAIHHIDNSMVVNKPKIQEVLPEIFQMVNQHIIMGHGIGLDITFLSEAAKRHAIPCNITTNRTLDTLRMARLYGESPTNSLERLREHFNIPSEGAHRAMSDVIVNIEVFKYLAASFQTTQQLFERLKRPIPLKAMPLGKYKGRSFSDIPVEYLQWAAHKDFDQDLLFSIRSELKKRKKGNLFGQAANPFSSL